jgi:hypothetical protein
MFSLIMTSLGDKQYLHSGSLINSLSHRQFREFELLKLGLGKLTTLAYRRTIVALKKNENAIKGIHHSSLLTKNTPLGSTTYMDGPSLSTPARIVLIPNGRTEE